MADFLIKDGETMVLIGDSITDCGRRGAEAPLGNGYVRMFTEMVTARFPERKINFINKGIGGHRITDLKNRWTDDVLYYKPDRLSIKIGINDIHSYLRGAPDAVSPELFAEIYDELLDLTKKELDCPVVLISPFYISNDRRDGSFRSVVLETMPRYVNTVEEMAKKYDARLVPLHDIFHNHLKYRDADSFCPEPVHPHHTGHMIIADALYGTLKD
jgi:lysophospholipase L1-like esterase